MKKPKKERVHTMQLDVTWVTTSTSWRDSKLIFEDSSGEGQPRKCTVSVRSPSDVAYLREKLNEIEAGWRSTLDAIKVGT